MLSNTVHLWNKHGALVHPLCFMLLAAFGCDDMAEPAFTWMQRNGNITKLGCLHSDYEWEVKCHGSKWIGSKSNCTDKQVGKLFIAENMCSKTPASQNGSRNQSGTQCYSAWFKLPRSQRLRWMNRTLKKLNKKVPFPEVSAVPHSGLILSMSGHRN